MHKDTRAKEMIPIPKRIVKILKPSIPTNDKTSSLLNHIIIEYLNRIIRYGIDKNDRDKDIEGDELWPDFF